MRDSSGEFLQIVRRVAGLQNREDSICEGTVRLSNHFPHRDQVGGERREQGGKRTGALLEIVLCEFSHTVDKGLEGLRQI